MNDVSIEKTKSTGKQKRQASETKVSIEKIKLTGKQKRHLRGLAHILKPILNIGKLGLTPAFFTQLDGCLLQHELIKVKVLEHAPEDHKFYSIKMSELPGTHVAQQIGHTLILYRAHPETPVIKLP